MAGSSLNCYLRVVRGYLPFSRRTFELIMKILQRFPAVTVSIAGVLLSAAATAIARPLPAPHTGMCSFNGVKERCVVEWDTDGSLYVTYLSDGKRVTYDRGGRRVIDGSHSYNAHVSDRGSYVIFTTQNGQTIIPLR